GTADFDLGVELARALAFFYRFREHPCEAIGISKLPMRFGNVGIGGQQLPEQCNRLLRPSRICVKIRKVYTGLYKLRIQRQSLFVSRLRLQMIFASSEVERGIRVICSPEMRPDKRVIRVYFDRFFKHIEGCPEIILLIEINSL